MLFEPNIKTFLSFYCQEKHHFNCIVISRTVTRVRLTVLHLTELATALLLSNN